MTPIDNTMSVIEETPATMRYRGLPWSYRPGECEVAADVLFHGEGVVRARNGFGRFIPTMTDITAGATDYTAGVIGYARGNARTIGVYVNNLATSNGEFYACAPSPVLLRTLGVFGVRNVGDFASVGNLGLYSLATGYDPAGPSNFIDTFLWYGGATSAAYSTGTATATRGGQGVTGVGTTWTTAMIGMWLTDTTGQTMIGKVAHVSSTTALTLERPALASLAAAAYKLIPVRNFILRQAKGRLTCSTGSAVVIGARTKFITGRGQGPGATWDVFRLADYAFVGTVTSFDSDLQVTLTGNAAVSMSNERFVMIPRAVLAYDGDNGSMQANIFFGGTGGGMVIEEHQGRLYMANRTDTRLSTGGATVWFSDDADYEAFDMSAADGDSLVVGRASQVITGMQSMTQGLAIFKANELWMLYGDDPTTYQLRKVADVGTVDGRSIQTYMGALCFVSSIGVIRFDGTSIVNLTSHLISPSTFAVGAQINPATQPLIGMCVGSHYLCCVQNLFGLGISARSGAPPGSSALVLDLELGSLSIFSNVQPLCAIALPGDSSSLSDVVWAGRNATADQHVNVFTASSLFGAASTPLGSEFGGSGRVTQNDYWAGTTPQAATSDFTPGPHPFIKVRRFNLDQGRMAYWKDLLLDYVCDDTTLQVDSYYGQLADTVVVSEATLPAGGALPNTAGSFPTTVSARARPRHRGSAISFAIYPTADPLPLTGGSSSWAIALMTLLYSPMRRMRT